MSVFCGIIKKNLFYLYRLNYSIYMYGCTSALGNRTESVQKMIDHKRPICKFCKTDVKSKEKVCERCAKNYKEHGKVSGCALYGSNSAFTIGSDSLV